MSHKNSSKPSMAVVRPFKPNLAELSVYKAFLEKFDLSFFYTGYDEGDCESEIQSMGLKGIRIKRYLGYTDFLKTKNLQRLLDFKIGVGSFLFSRLKEILDHDYINIVDPIYAYTYQIFRSLNPKQKLIIIRWENIFGRYDKIFLPSKVANKILSRADFVICTSKASLNTFPILKEFTGKIAHIYPGIFLKFIFKDNIDIKFDQVISSNTPSILFVGRVQWSKGIHDLIIATYILKEEFKLDVNLNIVGAGEINTLRNLVKSLRLEEKVKFWGPLSNKEVRNFMKNSTLFCFPSLLSPTWNEQFGFSLVEAMASKLPIVAYDTGVIKEILGDDGVYASAGNAYSLAEAMQKLVLDINLSRKIKENLRLRVLDKFDADKQGKEMLNFICP